MKKQRNLRLVATVLCLALLLSLSGGILGVFAQNPITDNGGGLGGANDSTLPDTDGGIVDGPNDDSGLVPAPDTDTDTDTDMGGGMDKDDAKPDDDENIADKDDGDGGSDKQDRKFNYAGLIIALVIGIAVVILVIVMIPSSRRSDAKNNKK